MFNLLFIDNPKELEKWVSILSDPHKAPESLDKMLNLSEDWKKRKVPVADVKFERVGFDKPLGLSPWITSHMKKHLEVRATNGKYYIVNISYTSGKELTFFTQVYSFAEPVGNILDLRTMEGYIVTKKEVQLIRKFEIENGREWVFVSSYPDTKTGEYYVMVLHTEEKENHLIYHFIKTGNPNEFKELWKKGIIIGGLRKTDYWNENDYAENTLIEFVYRTWGI